MSASSSKYHVLYNELRNKIENHILSEGDQLPSESELMAEYGISPKEISCLQNPN